MVGASSFTLLGKRPMATVAPEMVGGRPARCCTRNCLLHSLTDDCAPTSPDLHAPCVQSKKRSKKRVPFQLINGNALLDLNACAPDERTPPVKLLCAKTVAVVDENAVHANSLDAIYPLRAPALKANQLDCDENEDPLDPAPLKAVPPSEESEMAALASKNPAQSDNSSSAVPRLTMQWSAPLSLFVLNRVVELVHGGMNIDRGFKERYIQRVTNDVLDFTGLSVSTTQIYNHLRKWRARWVRLCHPKELPGPVWHEESSILMDDAIVIAHTMKFPKDDELLNKPIMNYAQMKIIYTRVNVPPPNLYTPHLLIQAINFLADHPQEQINYANMTTGERIGWLRNYLRLHFVAPIPMK